MLRIVRRLSTRALIALIAAVTAIAAGGAAIAVAAGGGGPTPTAKPLDQAIHDALGAAKPDGITARVSFTNNLFPSGALLGQVGSALMSGAPGRLWLTNDGHGRIELQSDAGDVQIVWNPSEVSAYDASSNTVYRAQLPTRTSDAGSADTAAAPTLAEVDTFLTDLGVDWVLSGAQPTNIAGRPAYSVTASPKANGGLLGSLELAWDSAQGVPLRAGIYARDSSSPALELAVTDISYGAVPSTSVDVAPPTGAKVVDLGTGTQGDSGASTPAVSGLDAVKAAAPFPVIVPASLDGRELKDVRLVGGDTVVAFFGERLDGIALVERKVDSSGASAGPLASLPTVTLNGVKAHELNTQLGTVLEWQTDGTSFVLAGSLPTSAAEAAAQAVR